MKRNVMVPLDGSSFAEQALPLAVTVARNAGAGLLLVRVQPTLPLGISDQEARDYLERVVKSLESQVPAGVVLEVLIDEYGALEYAPPASNAVSAVLRRRGAEADVQMMVLATHGLGGIARAWLGSVADALIRTAPKPVLLVRPADESFSLAAAADRGIHHILVPLDGSRAAAEVLPWVRELAELFGARLTLLRVVSPLSWQVSPHSHDPYPAYQSPLSRDAALEDLEVLAEPMRAGGLTVATAVVDSVSAAAAIVDYGRTHGADVIAIGTEGAGSIRRFFLGSITDKVVRSGELPVLVCNVRSMTGDRPAEAATDTAAV
jgi:nucleotide-binding universal stress UspA family protein